MDTYRMVKHMYHQKILEEGVPLAAHENDTISFVIVSDNHRSPAAHRSCHTATRRFQRQESTKRTSTSKSKRQRRQSTSNAKLLQEIRWQSISFGDQQQATAAVNAALQFQNGISTTNTATATATATNAAPRQPRRRGSMEYTPEHPRRRASIVEQALDGSNHSKVAAVAA